MSVCMSVCLSVCLSVCPVFICLCVCMSICPSVCCQCEILFSFLFLCLSLNGFHKILNFLRVKVRASWFVCLVTVCFVFFVGHLPKQKILGYLKEMRVLREESCGRVTMQESRRVWQWADVSSKKQTCLVKDRTCPVFPFWNAVQQLLLLLFLLLLLLFFGISAIFESF